MTLDQGQTETNDIQDIDDVEGHKRAAPLTDDGNDDVEGHRIASFVEDYKDDALGLRRSPDDLQGRAARRSSTRQKRTSRATPGYRSPTRTPTTTPRVSGSTRSDDSTTARRHRRAAVLSGLHVVGQPPQHGLRFTGGDRPVSSDDAGK